jgi:16S rRNA (guanine527-N7)-methyltransferase
VLDPNSHLGEVSRETLQKLEEFQELVRKWSPRINLVSQTDLKDMWQRHILDSAQLVALTSTPERWIDVGSGAGFPGIVVAILLRQQVSTPVTLVESDRRKSAFLMTVSRALDLDLKVVCQRVENLQASDATTMSARALAPLERLVGYANSHLSSDGTALFPKGRKWKNELQEAKEKWSFDCDVVQSATDSTAAILRLRNIK